MAYINGIGIISAQDTSQGIPGQLAEFRSDYMKSRDPEYKQFISPIAARRLSRLIRMGVTSARLALADAALEMPDAIITGTGLGSVEDTEKLLSDIHTGGSILNPTPFIQSTYNTISSQIAINLKCHNYNSTYVHRSISFESALIDGLMQLNEGMAAQVLAGGIDELTLTHLNIIRRLGHWKREPVSNLELLKYETLGALAGEGAAFFVVGNEPVPTSYCKVEALETFHCDADETFGSDAVNGFLKRHGCHADEIGLLLMGYNGDKPFDMLYDRMSAECFPVTPVAWFKNLCGEYYTSSAIGLWFAANILKSRQVPEYSMLKGTAPASIKNVLLYNHYRNEYHTLYLLTSL